MKRSKILMTSFLHSFVGQTLVWIPHHDHFFKPRYVLTAPDGTTLATYEIDKGLVPEGTLWIRQEKRSLKRVLTLGKQGPLLATYQPKWWTGPTGSRGQLFFPDGRELRWGKVNFWGTQKAWTDPTSQTAYVQFSAMRIFSYKSTVQIHPQAVEIPELSLLLVLGFYNILDDKRQNQD
jgi:hypothetical protein